MAVGEKNRSAVLLLDCQNDLLHPNGKFAAFGFPDQARTAGLIPRLQQFTTAARAAGWPVIYVGVELRPDYADVSATNPVFAGCRQLEALQQGSWGAQITDELQPQAGDFQIPKRRVNAFYQTNLELVLHTLGVQQIVLSGVATNLVVESTARWASDADYDVVVASDCCCSFNEEVHRFAIERILPQFGRVLSSAELESKMVQRASATRVR